MTITMKITREIRARLKANDCVYYASPQRGWYRHNIWIGYNVRQALMWLDNWEVWSEGKYTQREI